jgi:hypothetical protein
MSGQTWDPRMSKISRILGVISSVGLAAAIVSTPNLVSHANADDHLISWNTLPPAYTQVNAWLDSNTNSVPFSTNPWDSRNSVQNQNQMMRDFTTVLPVCASENSIGCVLGVEYSTDNGETWSKAKQLVSPGQRNYAFGRIGQDGKWDIAKSSIYPADPSKNLWQSEQPAYWELLGANHSLGNHYFINATVHSSADYANKSIINGIELSANAGEVRNISGIDCHYWLTEVDKADTARSDYCFEAVNMPTNLSLRMKVNLGSRIKELSGWFDGRLDNAVIDFGKLKAGQLVVEGKAVSINYVQTNPIKKGEPGYTVPADLEKMQAAINVGIREISNSRDGIDKFINLLPYMPDKAFIQNSVWRLNSWQASGSILGCGATSGLQGIVLSNATAYDSSGPRLNSSSQAIDFHVASSHLNPDGSLNLGTYTLMLQEKIAKCIWGESLSGQASVSVSDVDGVQTIATSSFVTKNGWAIFKAEGFHFSAPTISVKLTQASAKKTTITCVKGKLTKKVTAVGPKCPAGYKKK